MKEAKVLDLIGKYLTGNMVPAERSVLMQWLEESDANRAFFDEMIQLWAVSGRYDEYEEPFTADVTSAWEKVDERLAPQAGESRPTGQVIGLPHRWLLRVAAVLLIGLLAGYWLWQNPLAGAPPVTVTTETGETRRVELPDGSEVWLNENSQLSYTSEFSERSVTLSGEAFFDIRRRDGDLFEVRSGPARTVVLGTSFNVRAYPRESRIEVAVKSGKVALEEVRTSEKKVLLNAGESGVYVKKEREVQTLEGKSPNADAWKEQRLVFDNTQVRDVIRDLERYFGITLQVTDKRILNCTFSTSLPFVEPDLEEVLITIELALMVEIEKTEDHYLIKGSTCATGSSD